MRTTFVIFVRIIQGPIFDLTHPATFIQKPPSENVQIRIKDSRSLYVEFICKSITMNCTKLFHIYICIHFEFNHTLPLYIACLTTILPWFEIFNTLVKHCNFHPYDIFSC